MPLGNLYGEARGVIAQLQVVEVATQLCALS